VSRHVVFLEHILFFSIPSTTYSLTRPDIIHIDSFSKDFDSLSSQVPSTSNTLPMFVLFLLIILQVLTLYSSAHLKLHSHLQPLKLRLRLWIHIYVNPYTFISPQNYQILLCYSLSFTLFLAFVHCLSEPSFY
jgi:hypothetical protein